MDPATRANWFTPHNAMRVYTQYLELDEDQNGMLSKTELLRYGSVRPLRHRAWGALTGARTVAR